MKIRILSLLTMLTTLTSFSITYSNNKELTFCPIKGADFGLSNEFLTQIKTVFNPSIFIETGTYLGNTTALAASIFEQVYSVELGTDLYKNAVARFDTENKTNIHLFNSNSPDFLKDVIPGINQTMAIFLDAHWSEGNTVKGESNTPIITELDVIKNSCKSDCIILIDDIRCFTECTLPIYSSLHGYPTVYDLIVKGYEFFDNLGFIIFGDIAIMYNANIHDIIISDLLKAMTDYKLFRSRKTISDYEVNRFYLEIGKAQKNELNGISWLTNLSKGPNSYLYEDFLIWKALTLLHEKKINEAKSMLNAIRNDRLIDLNQKMLNFILNQ